MPKDILEIPLRLRALRGLRLAFGTWYPWDQSWLSGRLRPLAVREMEEDDIPWCIKLDEMTSRGAAPPIGQEDYPGYLESRKHIVFIAEDKSGRVGTFGLHRIDPEVACLSHLTVDPGARNSGVGATMLVCAIAMLETEIPEQDIISTTAAEALPFFRKLGFSRFYRELMAGKPSSYVGLSPITPALIMDCRAMLEKAGVTLPSIRRIPVGEDPLPKVAAVS